MSIKRQKKSNSSRHEEMSSASELCYLKAEVWTLQNKLKDEKESTKCLGESFKKLANEKYELIEELTRRNLLIEDLQIKLDDEVEVNNILSNEVEELNNELHSTQELLGKTITQNIELKKASLAASKTIHQMGLMYLRLKERNSFN